MKERPILFSAPMVRALLDGRKTQTRRIVKFKSDPPRTIFQLIGRDDAPTGGWFFSDPIYERVGRSGNFCPKGVPGDRLWVRETTVVHGSIREQLCGYVADGCKRTEPWEKTIPAIHMLRIHSRITLEITEVRVQRLQEIGVRDAIAEGADAVPPFPASVTAPEDFLTGYRQLWESINGPGSWAANPWVWAITFKAVA